MSTVRGYFYAWRNDGLLDKINRKLVEAARLAAERDVQPTAGIIDSQSVKTTKVEGLAGMVSHGAAIGSRPMANGKRIKG